MLRKIVLSGALTVVALSTFALCVAQNGPKVIHEKQSKFGLIVVTEDEAGLRTLQFGRDGVRQSVVKPGDPDHVELPYARSMFSGLALCPEPKRILIIGLGGGTIPSFLHKHYPAATIDVVEIDPEVIDTAQRFFGLPVDARLRAHAADGRKFVEEAKEPYDLVFLDAYSSDSIPYHLATKEFLEAVQRVTAPGGAVLGNVWSRHSNPLYDSMVRTYQEVFPELYVLDVAGAGNRILMAPIAPRRLNRDQFARRAAAISSGQKFRFDLGELVSYGYHFVEEKNIDGRVLRDR